MEKRKIKIKEELPKVQEILSKLSPMFAENEVKGNIMFEISEEFTTSNDDDNIYTSNLVMNDDANQTKPGLVLGRDGKISIEYHYVKYQHEVDFKVLLMLLGSTELCVYSDFITDEELEYLSEFRVVFANDNECKYYFKVE